MYGGCRGNANNFDTKQSCYDECKPGTLAPPDLQITPGAPTAINIPGLGGLKPGFGGLPSIPG